MAAFEVTPNGQVIPPLNITAPAPAIDTKGFHWTTVDDKFVDIDTTEALGTPFGGDRQHPIPANGHENGHHDSKDELPDVLAEQLGLNAAGQITAPALAFPLTKFQGSYAGNGFNMIFRPLAANDKTLGPNGPVKTNPPLGPNDRNDNILQLSLTLEQLTFGSTIGDIPNRGLINNGQETIFLEGLPYLQTIQDVTNPATGLGDSPDKRGIHFETGMWLTVPATTNPKNANGIVRMGSIPHGTTILAQANAPSPGNGPILKGSPGPPDFGASGPNVLDTTPFPIGVFANKIPFDSQDSTNKTTARLPQDLSKFDEPKLGGTGTITTATIKNPNLVLGKALEGLKVTETVFFEVETGDPEPAVIPPGTAAGTAVVSVNTGPEAAVLNGGGTANISFLNGTQDTITTASPDPKTGTPNAHAASMKSKFWIESVAYQVTVPQFKTPQPILLRPTMPNGSTAPTPQFLITPPAKLPSKAQTITVPGTQIQYEQNVTLNFAGLSWPHVSVATLVPTAPQVFKMV